MSKPQKRSYASADDLRKAAARSTEIHREIEQLTEEKEIVDDPLERAATLIMRSTYQSHGYCIAGRTTSAPRVKAVTDTDVRFEVWDTYEDEYEGAFTATFDELADPEKTVERLEKAKARRDRAALRKQQILIGRQLKSIPK
jgi:hypothetical protein